MGKSWFLDVNPGGVADKATADTACQASVIIDPGGVANKATAEAAGQASVIIDPGRVADTATADTAPAAEPAAAIIDPGGVAAKAAANTAEAEPAAATIDPGGVTLCGGPVSRLGAHDHNVVFGMSATANSSIVKSITSTCADFVGADPTTIAVGAIRKASAIITVGSVAVAYADPSVPAVGTDTNAPAVGAVNSVEALSNAYAVTVNTAVRARAPVGDPGYVDIQPFNDFATIGLRFSGHCSESAWEIETGYCANEAGGESHKKTRKHYCEAASCADSKQWEHLCIGRKRDAVDEFKEVLKAEYVTENGPVTAYVGMEFTRNREARTGFISMKKYMAKCNATVVYESTWQNVMLPWSTMTSTKLGCWIRQSLLTIE